MGGSLGSMGTAATAMDTGAIQSLMANAQAQAAARRQSALGSSLKQAEAEVGTASTTKMKDKAKEFESFYVYQTLELMTPENSSQFNGGIGEEMFKHQLNEELAKNITNAGGFGLADAVYGELVRQQQANTTPHP